MAYHRFLQTIPCLCIHESRLRPGCGWGGRVPRIIVFSLIYVIQVFVKEIRNKDVIYSIVTKNIRSVQSVFVNLKHVKVLHVFCPVFTDKKLKESNLETLFILYGMIAALCVSLIVNGCMIKWYVNQTLTFHIQFPIYIFVHMIYLNFNTLNILNITRDWV